ncbi:RNA binding protein, contains ribosomal protein S1 domain [Clostridiaceae bacterium JG1575]|nr:RNA binding protein, contains ribosomal protein S1 domain [Clostridiaceae bacterium JG1575]
MAMEQGAILEGTIVNITTFGAFIEVDGETGLVHISEIADSYVKDIKDFLKEGDKIKVKVLRIEPNGKISLSIKQANPDLKAREGTPSREARPSREMRGIDRSADSRGSEKRPYARPREEGSFERRPRPQEKGPQSFEDMMNRFSKESEEKMAEYKRRQDTGGNVKRRRG